MTHTMGSSGKRTLDDFYFGKRTARRQREREDRQINIQVIRFDKKKVKWGIRVSAPIEGMRTTILLPGEFDRWLDAEGLARDMARIYRWNRYVVALDTKTCRKRKKA